MDTILKISNLYKNYHFKNQKLEILKGVNLEIKRGESWALLGRSGSGKTTLLSLIAGLDMPTQGDIEFEGISILNINEDERTELRIKKIGIIFQQFHLLNHLNVLENVMIALEIAKVSDARKWALKTLFDVGLKDRIHHFPHELSGGEKQRVAIARSLSHAPTLLLADEPSGSLDEKTGNHVMDLIFDLAHKHKMGLILVTHSEKLAGRCQQKKILEDGKLKDVF